MLFNSQILHWWDVSGMCRTLIERTSNYTIGVGTTFSIAQTTYTADANKAERNEATIAMAELNSELTVVYKSTTNIRNHIALTHQTAHLYGPIQYRLHIVLHLLCSLSSARHVNKCDQSNCDIRCSGLFVICVLCVNKLTLKRLVLLLLFYCLPLAALFTLNYISETWMRQLVARTMP